MSNDWYNEGRSNLLGDLTNIVVDNMDNPEEQAAAVYSHLVNIGLIDYDVEKEYLWETYFGDED